MRVERVSWGKWLITSLVIGAVIAWLHDNVGRVVIVQSNAQVQFIAMLNRQPVKASDGKEYAWVKSVRVYPEMEIVQAYAKASTRKAQVTYDMLTPAETKGAWQYVAKSTLVDDPIDMGGKGPVPLTTYLSGLTKERPWVSYRYAFWSETRWIYGLWVGGSVLLIGIIWPLVVRRLAAAGYAGREEEKGPSLWKRLFGRKETAAAGAEYGDPAAARPNPMALSAADLQRIADMEANLGDFKMDRGPGGEVEDEAEPEIKKLNGTPRESKDAPAQAEQESKEYAGEFYPTETHVPKKKEQ